MVIYGEYRQEGDKIVCSVPCERCGTIIGDLSPDEVGALATGMYGKVLCFDCADNSCSCCQKEMTERDMEEGNYGVCWFCYQESSGVPIPMFIPDYAPNFTLTAKGRMLLV